MTIFSLIDFIRLKTAISAKNRYKLPILKLDISEYKKKNQKIKNLPNLNALKSSKKIF